MRLLLVLVAVLAGCAQTPQQPSGPPWQQRHPALALVSYAPFPGIPDSVIHALRVDLHAPGVRVLISPQAERNKTVADMAGSADALASVNASYYNKAHEPRGLTVSEGVAWSPISAQQTSPLLACDEKPRCTIQLHGPFELKPGWRNVVAGTPWLLDEGRERTAEDDKACGSHCAATHPRTAVGLDASGRWLYLVVTEGRRPPVLGLTLTQLSRVMRELGAQHALNLDGGGSSTLMLQGESLLARPFNEPQLRRVANAIHIRVD